MAGMQMFRPQPQQQRRPDRGGNVSRANATKNDDFLLDFIPGERQSTPPIVPDSVSADGGMEHKTKLGTLDRRFKGQRDLPPEEVNINPNYVHPTSAETLPDGTHITRFGKPDLRFKENRSKDEETVLAEWAEKVYETYGRH